MDTLCVPVGPAFKKLRQKAIGSMALTYAAASKCLVLDPELSQISAKGLSGLQLNAHVLCSNWVRRSWTFQEAKLSRVWYIQFQDGLYNPNSIENANLEHRLYNHWNLDESDAHALASEAIIWYHDMPPARSLDLGQNQARRELLYIPTYLFETIWNNLVSRSTSKPEDIHGILANLLDLNATEVLAFPLEDRMKAILCDRETLSPGIVYSKGRKIQDPTNRWVPIFPSTGYLSPSYGQMRRIDGGYLLDTENANPVGFIVDRSTPRYSKLRIVDSSVSTSTFWITFWREDDGPKVDFEAPGDKLAVCYVLGDLKETIERRTASRRMQGARFALRRLEGETLHLVYEYSFSYGVQLRNPFLEKEEEYPIVHAKRTGENAVFQIDCDFTSFPRLLSHRDTASAHYSHGLYFYVIAFCVGIAVIWIPFIILAALSRLFLGVAAWVIRAVVGMVEVEWLKGRVNEHAYRAWVKTFDEDGAIFRPGDSSKRDQERRRESYVVSRRAQLSFVVGVLIWVIALLGEGTAFLRWVAAAVWVEIGVRWVMWWVWWRTGVRRVVKAWWKARGWW
ncbi:MAG: hypothetical protein Q9219_003721 [cf. Caloplaca sp. 3 TL-2023]